MKKPNKNNKREPKKHRKNAKSGSASKSKQTPKAFAKFDRKKPVEKEERNERGRGGYREERKPDWVHPKVDEPIRLNRFIAQSGVCSRREADELIRQRMIKVNGKVVSEMGLKVQPSKDKVEYKGKVLQMVGEFVYLLMNKPKNHITTVKDDKGRRTVMDIVKHYTDARVYPVGRLDRNTTGLLLFTNDGDLAKRLTHPSHKVRKLYHVRLDQEVPEEHLDLLREGIELEDGLIKVDKIAWVEGGFTNEVGVSIHSGRNRIVRRMFEHLGYKVEKLDRVAIGGLTKKNIPRGKCRFLSQKEIRFLKMV